MSDRETIAIMVAILLKGQEYDNMGIPRSQAIISAIHKAQKILRQVTDELTPSLEPER